MSAVFLENLYSFSVDASSSQPHQLSSIPPVTPGNIHERSTVPGPVGTLPRDSFIYILIGVLVFLCCMFALWDILEAIKFPKRYVQATKSEVTASVTSRYRERRPAVPGKLNTMARGEVGMLRTEPKYRGDGFLGPTLAAKPNLPIPIVMEIWDVEQPGVRIDAHAMSSWVKLIREKETLNITVANLERLAQARDQAGQQDTMNPRLLRALHRRAEVGNLINSEFERFKERRSEWSPEEWQIILLIMQHSL